MATLSCITTTHNEGPLLLNAVRSVLGQSFQDFEYLIVDDGSSEETLEILSRLEDPRLRLIRQSQAGLSAARNTGIAAATGDYICFLDADDLRPNWSFAVIAKTLDILEPDVLLCPGILCDRRGQIDDFFDAPIFAQIAQILPQGISHRQMEKHGRICALAQQIEPQSANKVVRRSFLQATGLCFPEPYFFEDIFFHTLTIAQADSLAFLDTPTFTYFQRYQRSQITSTTCAMRFDIISVVKLTLDAFASLPESGDAAYRAVVLESCLKLVKWSETSLTYPLRAEFRKNFYEMVSKLELNSTPVQSDGIIKSDYSLSFGNYDKSD
jgi:glycosyltransferase involved in cell wall biosynthesis